MHFSIFTSPKTLLTPSQTEQKGFFALMPLADACALLRRRELDILHILCYKYPRDIYCTRKGSGAKALGSYSILLSLFIVVVKSLLRWTAEIMWEPKVRRDFSALKRWKGKQESNFY